ncbi:hypothetical protein F511_09758 [Dorcoceras hygrometricum]|uniref:Uncharacterized protein n=1 Tax=Dorcoceras hygrometricum TaxID=472368 RepID=A0A2Z7D4I8_9LAMI|nr:hypothetical protein F511_09758 [Dorcoceras hygrometricum]
MEFSELFNTGSMLNDFVNSSKKVNMQNPFPLFLHVNLLSWYMMRVTQLRHSAISDDPHRVSAFARIAAQLRDLVSSISSEKLQSQELLSSFKSDFNERMKSLELSVEDLRTSHMALVNKQWRQHLDLLRRGDKLKADLSSEITAIRMMLHEEAQKQSSE